MEKNIDRELPVVTGLGTFLSIGSMARLDTPLGHGIQFGVGKGKKPISNFPGEQTGFRPLFGDERMAKISVNGLLDLVSGNYNECDLDSKRGGCHDYKGKIDRVTVKVERETDQEALLDVVQGIREKLSGAEIVVSSHYISTLEKVRDGDVKPDVLQQLIPEFRRSVMDVICYALGQGTILSGSEVSFPFPNIGSPSFLQGEIDLISRTLADRGHDSHVNHVETQGQVGDFVKASSMFNFGQRCRAERTPDLKYQHKLRGFYVRGVPHGLKLTGSDVNFASMGEGLWADKNVEERATK